jgi:quercetin dioxygenase-like cupin family protein
MKDGHMTAARITVFVTGCLLAPTMIGEAQQGGAKPPLIDGTKTLIMQPEQALAGARVMGDPAKPGWYVSRTRFAAGSGTRPHYHDQDRYVTVIAGTWWTGAGDVYKPETMVPIKAGGFMFHPAGYHHYDQARDEDVVVQIIGVGPVKTVRTEVDEKGGRVQ